MEKIKYFLLTFLTVFLIGIFDLVGINCHASDNRTAIVNLDSQQKMKLIMTL